ncbi:MULTISPECIES: hypothetical protein [Mycobacteriales]|jgi:hypothetical protein|uniref:hypothetical protein n=1 Tax=Mycobacteriales TaxID=85007 RepID=UPI00057318EB|nr:MULTISPECIES: hypothetical protein [Mycobacteriales]AQA07178.1 hypothetical protein BVC93_32350 [Mycobacterium sp. MS1601]KHJ74043.1 hypothetical protein QR64_03710 [Rhodococcus sp. Chr-9]
MDQSEREILEFVILWAPFGGPDDEEVFVRFGISVPQLYERFDSTVRRLSAGTSVALSPKLKMLATRAIHLHRQAWPTAI